MRQISQNYRTGELCVTDVPASAVKPNALLVRTAASLVSVGTEKHMLEFAQKGLLGKALARPDLVRQVIAKAQAEGPLEAWRQAMGRLDTPVPLGYSSTGVVIGVGSVPDSASIIHSRYIDPSAKCLLQRCKGFSLHCKGLWHAIGRLCLTEFHE